jgi:lysophospholipase L1-like esterase
MAPRRRLPVLLLLALSLAACGGGGSPPTQPGPPPEPRYPVTVVVFYDENDNGLLDPGEVVRLPDVDVLVGTATAKTERGTGRATVMALAGAQTVSLRPESLPAFFTLRITPTVTVPATAEVRLPVTLPIPPNLRPNVYMAFGDSITTGLGSSDGTGYRNRLDFLLTPYLGFSDVVNEGRDGTQTNEGADRVGRALNRQQPAYTLILYGTNDWNRIPCQMSAPCDTPDFEREIIDQVKAFGSLPVLSTIIPANPALNSPERNQWVAAVNAVLRDLAREEGAALADPEKAFLAAGDMSRLFSDHIHPNDSGYDLIAQAFFQAITGPRGTSATARSKGRLGFVRPGS